MISLELLQIQTQLIFPPTDMPFGDHKTETKDLGGMFCILRLAVCFVLLFEAHSVEPNVSI